jgi:hypothetical protein
VKKASTLEDAGVEGSWLKGVDTSCPEVPGVDSVGLGDIRGCDECKELA